MSFKRRKGCPGADDIIFLSFIRLVEEGPLSTKTKYQYLAAFEISIGFSIYVYPEKNQRDQNVKVKL